MKKLILLAVVFMSLSTMAQNKGDNAIIYKSQGIQFKELLKLVVSAGYEIETSNEDAGQISTRFKSIGKKIQSYRMKIIYNKDSVVAQGYWKTGVDFPGMTGSGNSESIVAYRGPNNGPTKVAFSEMLKFFSDIEDKKKGTVKTKVL